MKKEIVYKDILGIYYNYPPVQMIGRKGKKDIRCWWKLYYKGKTYGKGYENIKPRQQLLSEINEVYLTLKRK